MTLFRSVVTYVIQILTAIDTASALRHGNSVSDRSRRLCMNPVEDTQSQVAVPTLVAA